MINLTSIRFHCKVVSVPASGNSDHSAVSCTLSATTGMSIAIMGVSVHHFNGYVVRDTVVKCGLSEYCRAWSLSQHQRLFNMTACILLFRIMRGNSSQLLSVLYEMQSPHHVFGYGRLEGDNKWQSCIEVLGVEHACMQLSPQ